MWVFTPKLNNNKPLNSKLKTNQIFQDILETLSFKIKNETHNPQL